MTKHLTSTAISALLASRIPSAVVGRMLNEADPVAGLIAQVKSEIQRIGSNNSQTADELRNMIERVETRQRDLEQSIAGNRRRGGGGDPSSWGETVVRSEEFKLFVSNSCKGKAKIGVSAALTSISTSGGALIRPDRDATGVMLPRRRMTIRALLGQGRTASNLVEYFKEKTFTNNADVVAEGAQKAESVIEYELDNAPVRTIAHWVPASRQVMDDAPQLGTLVDTTLRYGLAIKEENQLLYGDGTGQNIHGMVPQATAFEVARVESADDTRIDVVRHAISQAEEADLPASGIILNTRDWMDILGTKDGDGNYISNGPWSGGPGTLWGLPVVWTNSMLRGDFLVGAFETATTLWDRMDPEVMVSDEDRDNFIKNMLTIRAEERLAFAVKRAAALITGDFAVALGL